MARGSARGDPGSSVDDIIDRLYSLDPDEFTKERNEAAKRLGAEGDRTGSDLIKALRRPTVAAWAVNELSRRRPDLVGELLEAGADLRSAQRATLSGSGRGDLLDASQRRRAVVAALLDEATKVFREGGRNPDPHVDAIRSTLEAASVDEATGDLVRSGRLTKEAEPPSGLGDVSPFEVLAGGGAAPAKGQGPGDEGSPEESPVGRRLRERMEARAARAESAVAAARETAAAARSEALTAAKEVDRLERELRTAQRRAERASNAAQVAEGKVEQSEQELARAQGDLHGET